MFGLHSLMPAFEAIETLPELRVEPLGSLFFRRTHILTYRAFFFGRVQGSEKVLQRHFNRTSERDAVRREPMSFVRTGQQLLQVFLL